MAVKYLDETGLAYLWAKIKAYVDSHAGSGTPTPTANATSAFDSSAKMNSTDMTSAQVSDFVDSLSGSGIAPVDYIVEQGTSGIWTYRKWNSGIAECWGTYSHSFTGMTAWGSLYYSTPNSTVNFPTNLFVSAPTTEISRSGGVEGWAGINTVEASRLFGMYLIRPTTNAAASTQFHIYAIGRWK